MFDFIAHEGKAHDEDPPGRGSGRYAWGSGGNPEQHQSGLSSTVKELRKRGLKDGQIAKELLGEKATINDLRAEIAIESKRKWLRQRQEAIKLYDELGNKSEVARKMGIGESQVRNLLDDTLAYRKMKYDNTADKLRELVKKNEGYLDVGSSTEHYLGVNENTKDIAIKILEKEGYKRAWVPVPQLGTQHNTTRMVLVAPDVEYKDVFDLSKNKIGSVVDFTPDDGKTWFTPKYPESIDSKRVWVRYKEDGGDDKDGVVELRKGVEDISLGPSMYAQVRIAVDNKAYMKGMALYSDEIPDGYDVVYNTNKKRGTKVIPDSEDESGTVMKHLKIDKGTGEVDRENPFGALIKAGGQREYQDENGDTKLSIINKLQEEGDWDSWGRTVSAQFLAKQPQKLINLQLDATIKKKRDQLDEIMSLTNPVVKQKMLNNFAGKCDSNAADLSAVGFKGQAFQVLLPVSSVKENEIYAPGYNNGEQVAVIRYPHGGTFEILNLTVNNNNPQARALLGNAKDAIGIKPSNKEVLSGADFDGDTGLVIPQTSNSIKVQTIPPLEALKNWDNKEGYKLPDDAPNISSSRKELEMGKVTNLIMDMTVGGADPETEIAKAVKHSMVVIDSQKHHLDYKQSYIDQDIENLKIKYQGVHEDTGKPKGASTVLTRANSQVYIPSRKEVTNTSIMTEEELEKWNEGKRVWRPTGETKKVEIKNPDKMTEQELARYKAGKRVWRDSDKLTQTKVRQMDIVDDAFELVRDPYNTKEVVYAKFANDLKALANEARRESRKIKPTPVNHQAKEVYKEEVESLKKKVVNAEMNDPKERQAQSIGNAMVSAKFADNPDMDYEHRQRQRDIALRQARNMVGAHKEKVDITDREWEAIQSNAISTNLMRKIVKNADQEKLTKLAMPKNTKTELSNSEISLAKAMLNNPKYSIYDVAERFGVSTSTIRNIE